MKLLGGFGYFEKKSMLTPQLEPFSPRELRAWGGANSTTRPLAILGFK